jgi:hypothetical protein
MKHLFLSIVSCLILLLFFNKQLSAQAQIIVNLNNGNTETFALSEIRSIKFGVQTMNLKRNNGNISTWNISDITNYHFENASGINDNEQAIGKLQVYPNPAQEYLSISFSVQATQHIRLELLDVLGRSIREIFNGTHMGEQSYTWQIDVPKGHYLLRLDSENGQLTQSIIIQ